VSIHRAPYLLVGKVLTESWCIDDRWASRWVPSHPVISSFVVVGWWDVVAMAAEAVVGGRWHGDRPAGPYFLDWSWEWAHWPVDASWLVCVVVVVESKSWSQCWIRILEGLTWSRGFGIYIFCKHVITYPKTPAELLLICIYLPSCARGGMQCLTKMVHEYN